MSEETPRPIMLYVEDGKFMGKEMVFCKDCKYWDYEVDNDVGFCVRTEDCDWNADDFCSRGERKDENLR